jgi:ferredoxin
MGLQTKISWEVRMKVVVDPDLCMGCGVCESIAPDIFAIRDELFAQVIMEPVPEKMWDVVEEAISECPEQAISAIEEN